MASGTPRLRDAEGEKKYLTVSVPQCSVDFFSRELYICFTKNKGHNAIFYKNQYGYLHTYIKKCFFPKPGAYKMMGSSP